MVRRKTPSSARRSKLLFGLGALLLLVGLTGIILRFLGVWGFSLAEIIDEDVAWYSDVRLDLTEQVFSFDDGNELLPLEQLQKNLALPDTFQWKNWVKDRLFLASHGPDAFVLAFKSQQGGGAKTFIESLNLPGEQVHTFILNDERFYSPAYSSLVVAGNIDDYVVVVSSETVARRVLFSENQLSDRELYKNLAKKIPRRSFAQFFGVTARLTQSTGEQSIEYKPLFDALGATLPGVMVSLRGSQEQVAVHMNVQTTPGAFSDRVVAKDNRSTLPALAQFAPRDVLFFMNGMDLSFKYDHTRSFLSHFHPQFALMFEGVMKAESKRIFGNEFDFEQDFLQALGGQYAIILNGIDPESSRLGMTLVSGLRSFDGEAALSSFHQAVRRAQSAFSTRTQTVELPDGTTREELVAVNPQEISIAQKTFEGIDYFTAEGPQADTQFSYALVDNYFVFSTHEEGMQSVLTTYKRTGESESLSANSDFRESVLFRFSPSESYGFLNASKWSEILSGFETLISTTGEESPAWVNFAQMMGERVRSLSFARKIHQNQAVMDVLLFPR